LFLLPTPKAFKGLILMVRSVETIEHDMPLRAHMEKEGWLSLIREEAKALNQND